MAETWRTEVIDSIEDVRALRDEWVELESRALSASPFLSFEWMTAWWDSFAPPTATMHLVVARRGDRLEGLAPLYVVLRDPWTGRTRKTLRFWANPSSNRVNLVVSESCAAEATRVLAERIAATAGSLWDVGFLGPVVLDDPVTLHMAEAFDSVGIPSGVEEGFSSPFRTLSGLDADALDRSLGSSFRKSLNRKANKARRAGAVPEISFDSARLPDALAVSEDTWQHRSGTGIGSTPELRRFYETVSAARPGWLQLALLDVEGRAVAFELNLIDRGTAYNLKVGYREGDAGLSPGAVLRREVLRRCLNDGLDEFDFLGAEEAYKMHWASGTRLHGHLALFPHGLLHGTGRHLLRFRVRRWVATRLPALLAWKRSLQQKAKATRS